MIEAIRARDLSRRGLCQGSVTRDFLWGGLSRPVELRNNLC